MRFSSNTCISKPSALLRCTLLTMLHSVAPGAHVFPLPSVFSLPCSQQNKVLQTLKSLTRCCCPIVYHCGHEACSFWPVLYKIDAPGMTQPCCGEELLQPGLSYSREAQHSSCHCSIALFCSTTTLLRHHNATMDVHEFRHVMTQSLSSLAQGEAPLGMHSTQTLGEGTAFQHHVAATPTPRVQPERNPTGEPPTGSPTPPIGSHR